MAVVYLATPIDFVDYDSDREAFRIQLMNELVDAGHTVYDPSAAWHVQGPIDGDLARTIEGTNRQALRRSDVIVAWLPEGVHTQGVPMEIEAATRQMGLPAIVIGRIGVSLIANRLVTVLDEGSLEKVPRQIELLLIEGRARPDSVIRYSAPDGVELKPAHHNDAGLDLRASEDVMVMPHKTALVPTGVRINLPVGTFAWIVARSSTYGTSGLMVLPGVIDEAYQGELFANVLNDTPYPVRVHRGDRVAQVLLLSNLWAGFAITKTEQEYVFPYASTRGDQGFGSSGR